MFLEYKKKGILVLIFLVFLFIISNITLSGVQIKNNSSGIWNLRVDSTDLKAGSGTVIVVESSNFSDEFDLKLTGLGNSLWQVDVKREDNLPDGLSLYVKRISNKKSKITGGTSYKLITDEYSDFFSGMGQNSVGNIPGSGGNLVRLQYKLEGLCNADIFETAITYRITILEDN
ncbi:MAG: hypothetical protein ACOCRO_04310 [Halanaerobiales bacterium]